MVRGDAWPEWHEVMPWAVHTRGTCGEGVRRGGETHSRAEREEKFSGISRPYVARYVLIFNVYEYIFTHVYTLIYIIICKLFGVVKDKRLG